MPSGADLEYARLLAAAGQTSGVGMDGARLEQLGDSLTLDARGYNSADEKRYRALRRFHSKIADINTGTVSILCGPSDSIGDGLGASSFATKWTSILRDRLRSELGLPVGGMGYSDLWNQAEHNDHPVTENVNSFVNTDFGLGRQSLNYISGPNAGYTSFKFTGTHCDLLIGVAAAGALGSLQWAVDGGPTQVYNTGTAPFGTGGYVLEHASLQNLAPGEHTVLFMSNAGGNQCIVEGIMVYDGDKTNGVHMWEAGQSGATAEFFDYNTSPYWWQSLAAVSPDLIILPIGSNDYAQGKTLKETRVHIESIVDTLPDVSPGQTDVSIVLVPYYERSSNAPEAWVEWQQMYHDIADSRDNVCVFNLTPIFGPWNNDNRGGLVADTTPGGQVDLVHPSDLGHSRIANSILEFLLAGVNTAPKVTSSDIRNIVSMTQVEYDALPVKVPTTLYVILGV